MNREKFSAIKFSVLMIGGIAGLLGVLIPLNAAAQEVAKYPITIGTDGRTQLWTDTPANTGSAHGTRVYCAVSHLSYDDPVVFPGEPSAAHLHTFWGNTETDYSSTAHSLLDEGRSSCEGGLNNLSAYWAPTLFDENDQAMIPYDIIVYYKSFGGPNFDRYTIQPVPNGLKMLANQNVNNSYVTHFKSAAIGASRLQLSVNFPTCVAVNPDGTPTLESSDNTSHLSYSSTAEGNANDCPTSHPYRIPEVIYNIRYRINPTSNWYLASDESAATQGESLHADYIAVWDEFSMNELVRCNIEERRSCEFGNQAGDRDQLSDRHISPAGEVLYQYGLLRTTVDTTPFGTMLGKGGHPNHPVDDPDHPIDDPGDDPSDDPVQPVDDPDFVVKVTSLLSGSGWVVYSSGVNTGHRQWISETCRAQLADAGVAIIQLADYYAEVGDLPEVANWKTCDVLLDEIPTEPVVSIDVVLKVNSLTFGSAWIVYESGANAGQYQWVSESCRTHLADSGVPVVQIQDYHVEIGALPAVANWQTCDALLSTLSQ